MKKLNLDRNDLFVGRESELKQLNFALQEATATTRDDDYYEDDGHGGASKFSMVLVGGYSGTGKSRLVETFRRRQQKRPLCFLSGKFEEELGASPYSAFGDALRDYCGDPMMMMREQQGRAQQAPQVRHTSEEEVVVEADFDDIVAERKLAMEKFLANVGGEAKALTNAFPILKRVIPTTTVEKNCQKD